MTTILGVHWVVVGGWKNARTGLAATPQSVGKFPAVGWKRSADGWKCTPQRGGTNSAVGWKLSRSRLEIYTFQPQCNM
jgi:hypothetical protein